MLNDREINVQVKCFFMISRNFGRPINDDEALSFISSSESMERSISRESSGKRYILFDNYSEWDGAGSSFAGVDKRYHAGNDTLIMRDLSREQVVMRLSGDDLEIGIKEEGKAFSGLSDVLTIKNWRNPNNRIETI